MRTSFLRASLGLSAVAAVVALGCGKPDEPKVDKPVVAASRHADKWWCDEHGVPEAECSMCSAKVHKAAQEKGELCPKHPDRAKGQCYICDPSLKSKYNAIHKAKTGVDMPEPTEQKE